MFPKRAKSCPRHAIGEQRDTSGGRDWCAAELSMVAIGRHNVMLLAIKYKKFLKFREFFHLITNRVTLCLCVFC